MKKRILTGDRPTGKLHLGHYIGSMQEKMEAMEQLKDFISTVVISLMVKALLIITNPQYQITAIRLMMT